MGFEAYISQIEICDKDKKLLAILHLKDKDVFAVKLKSEFVSPEELLFIAKVLSNQDIYKVFDDEDKENM